MPELPEVECLCRMMRPVLSGRTIRHVKALPDPIVFKKTPSPLVEKELTGAKVETIGRKGKVYWIGFEGGFALLGHLGMSGWIDELKEDEPEPRFLKLLLETNQGKRLAFTDPRRLGRLWLADDPLKDPSVAKLGFDALNELPSAAELLAQLGRRKAPIKAVLLDQGAFAGIGNYLADEVLYHARIAPKRLAAELSKREVSKLREAIHEVVEKAVSVDADSDRFPESWLFHHRWGGKRGSQMIGANAIVREEVGGRTTAWVPKVQK